MEYWFSEEQTSNVKLSIRVDRQLYSGKASFSGLMCLIHRSLAGF